MSELKNMFKSFDQLPDIGSDRVSPGAPTSSETPRASRQDVRPRVMPQETQREKSDALSNPEKEKSKNALLSKMGLSEGDTEKRSTADFFKLAVTMGWSGRQRPPAVYGKTVQRAFELYYGTEGGSAKDFNRALMDAQKGGTIRFFTIADGYMIALPNQEE